MLVPDLLTHGEGEDIPLKKEESTHLRARRLRDGDEVIALDGKGARARARVACRGTAVVLLTFEENPGLVSSLPGEPGLRITVLVACAEPARVEWAVEKGTECGAAGFVLLETARSQRAHVAALRTRRPRLSRIAAEAAKQCDRTIVPGVEGPERIGDFLKREEGRGGARAQILVADSSGPPLEKRICTSSFSLARGVAIAIGPEGGFTPAEISFFEGSGALRVSLGPRVLRLETAVVAALTLLAGGR